MEWLTVLKAFERSKKTPTSNSPRSIADEIFSCKLIKASVVEWFFLKPNCCQERNPCSEASRSERKPRIIEEGHYRGKRRHNVCRTASTRFSSWYEQAKEKQKSSVCSWWWSPFHQQFDRGAVMQRCNDTRWSRRFPWGREYFNRGKFEKKKSIHGYMFCQNLA